MCLTRKIFAHATSIFEIDIAFYKENGIDTLLVDLDNTLDSYKLYAPSERVVSLLKTLNENGIQLFIISNNKGKRVNAYAKALGVEYLSSARKPFAKKLNVFITEKNLNKESIAFIGDQMLTDMGAANKANIKAILTDKIVKEDQWTTHFNRIIDVPMRKKYAKKGKLTDWRTLYGKN
jgi:HAD superfamily phosphatase (TIGR01668 family)